MANSRLNGWTSANTVKISTRNSITWAAEIRQALNQSRPSSTYFFQHSGDVTEINAKKQILPRSAKTRTGDYSRSKNWMMYLVHQPPTKDQKWCNNIAILMKDEKRCFHIQKLPKNRNRHFPMSKQGPKSAHASEPVAKIEIPPYWGRTAVNSMRKQNLCTMGPHSMFKGSTRRVSWPHEGTYELSTCP